MAAPDQTKQLNKWQEFIGETKTLGLARTNRFIVSMSPPDTVQADQRRMILFCSSA